MDFLKLENQLCFPLYALSRKVTAHYKPLLDELDLTYPQYLVMLLLWEHQTLSVKELGDHLMLDSGTLTPLLKRLEQKKIVSRKRSAEDERIVLISLTPDGKKLQEKAVEVPNKLQCSLSLSDEDIVVTRSQIIKLLNKLKDV
ncbi:MarR family winged helix-turn-helix transcriptional regulator [Solitalea canadensis]|uniref:Transcriptional regulator n=1 Tax=Solitalea canadensis (strain ATCC 29591 / DSM 3403 / JCM 21819 / LMG 8368 / NBRC 15130 / NCIMB 12057 / USAM 9D) TaxID=929556 RepID=H8KMJ6_SOLCM|nr:MarR family transcriptional regulator [Solitalea canadensis]AFD08987.1 transcriptional regulator [Solitalea canadensis DSM 3403]